MNPNIPDREAENTSATDEELEIASGGKATGGDGIGLGPEDNDQ